ncbi:MAG: metalloprotease TldD [Rhodospirillales bacterium]|nr:metalloprotease TldD [Rhodospirillales bacterium]
MTKTHPDLETFFKGSDLTPEKTAALVKEGLEGSDYGELYQERVIWESLAKDQGQYVNISTGNSAAGFGFRIGKGERVGYAYADTFNEAALKEAIAEARLVLDGNEPAAKPQASGSVKQQLYPVSSMLNDMTLAEKIAAMDEIETYVRQLDEKIKNVSLSFQSREQTVHVNAGDQSLVDNRPMTSLRIDVMVEDENGKNEVGYASIGGPMGCKDVFNKAAWQKAAHKAHDMAKTLLVAEDAPSGVMDVVLASGWPAVILHEAVGHGLEGDFNRKGISVYSGKMGTQVANPAVTIVDQGDMPGERGSLHFDDEGIPTQENVLVENGILKAYMHDRQSALLTGEKPTGNGRRESYRDLPMPRMTNTYFRPGNDTPEDIIKSVKDGIYIAEMAGGNVDITSGRFTMQATLAYKIRDGKICEPLKGATLVGEGHEVIKTITKVGNDLKLEKSSGTCGKDGQGVPVGIGQPTILATGMTVGGPK